MHVLSGTFGEGAPDVVLGALADTRLGLYAAYGVSRALPPAAARRLVRSVARRLVRDPESPLVSATRSNRWVVSGRTLTGDDLDAAVVANLEMAGRFVYDLYHVPDTARHLARRVVADETFERLALGSSGRGCIYASCHTGNFDLMGRALGHAGLRAQVLSVAAPTSSYRWQNEQRERSGLTMTPVSVESLKRAARLLADGGTVITGLDRPLPDAPADARPRFFGEPAPLPLLHVRLAMRTGATVVVLAPVLDPDGRYRLRATPPLEMTASSPLENAELVLTHAERFIAEAPDQWIMPHRVWPDGGSG